jgi:hypothetical protein
MVVFFCQFHHGKVGANQADGALMVANGYTFRLIRPIATREPMEKSVDFGRMSWLIIMRK